jgi:hypothetical protein
VAEPITALTSTSMQLIAAWAGDLVTEPSAVVEGRGSTTDGRLTTVLDGLGIPWDPGPNPLGGPQIRLDSTFDHLSLLYVRAPASFVDLADAASDSTDLCAGQIRGHIAYIERRFLDAARLYADLLAEQPGDIDLWRDVCWALRHAGHEEIVRTWVLNPTEVVQVAEAGAWQTGRPDVGPGPDNLGKLLAYLEWITHALGSR